MGTLSLAGIIYGSLPLLASYYFHQGKKGYQQNKFNEARNDFKKAVIWNNKLNIIIVDYLLTPRKKVYKENQLAQAENDF